MFFLQSDRLGTPQFATDSNARPEWKANYQPFGAVRPVILNLAQNLRLPGQYADQETGYYHNGFRDYDPSLGRYLESDPIGLGGGLNTYAYVNGNPLSWRDVRGLSDDTDAAATAGQAGTGATTLTLAAYAEFIKNQAAQALAAGFIDAAEYGAIVARVGAVTTVGAFATGGWAVGTAIDKVWNYYAGNTGKNEGQGNSLSNGLQNGLYGTIPTDNSLESRRVRCPSASGGYKYVPNGVYIPPRRNGGATPPAKGGPTGDTGDTNPLAVNVGNPNDLNADPNAGAPTGYNETPE